ncbi:hypothetical protein BX600DRAFT_205753 [Xylariales sp. PMI_506]|nr:hypothetical protein BX600DRAFT_205753 [Xylariales sp. PMI_506]
MLREVENPRTCSCMQLLALLLKIWFALYTRNIRARPRSGSFGTASLYGSGNTIAGPICLLRSRREGFSSSQPTARCYLGYVDTPFMYRVWRSLPHLRVGRGRLGARCPGFSCRSLTASIPRTSRNHTCTSPGISLNLRDAHLLAQHWLTNIRFHSMVLMSTVEA